MEELQYHEQRDLKNKKKLQELLAALPPFCADFFRGTAHLGGRQNFLPPLP